MLRKRPAMENLYDTMTLNSQEQSSLYLKLEKRKKQERNTYPSQQLPQCLRESNNSATVPPGKSKEQRGVPGPQ